MNRLAGRQRIFGEFVAQIGEREFQSPRQFHRFGDRFGNIAKKPRHRLGRFEIALGISRQQASGFRHGLFVANRGERVEKLALFRRRVANAVGGKQRQL
jgi:hypothetical protein